MKDNPVYMSRVAAFDRLPVSEGCDRTNRQGRSNGSNVLVLRIYNVKEKIVIAFTASRRVQSVDHLFIEIC